MAPYERRIQFQSRSGGTPSVIINLLIANILFFALQLISAQRAGPHPTEFPLIDAWFSLWPLEATSPYPGQLPHFYPWQLLTYGFLHSTQSFAHIILNMFVLWMFGSPVAHDFGTRRFLTYYLLCIVGAGLTQLLMPFVGYDAAPVVGASGGTFGLLLAYGWRFPHNRIMLLFPPIPMKARTAVIVFGCMELFFGATGLRTGIAHFAHLGGLVTGILLLAYWRGKLPVKPSERLP